MLAKLPPPDFYRFLEPVQAAWPGALFLHIVRDGRPVSFSLRPKFERRLDPRSALLAAARHWIDALDGVHAVREIEQLELRYEDLCEDVHGVIRAILDRAALDPEAFPFQRCPSRLEQTNWRWVDQATPRELEEVSEIQREQLNRFGYPLVLAPRQPERLMQPEISTVRVRGPTFGDDDPLPHARVSPGSDVVLATVAG